MPKIVDHELYRKQLLLKCFDLFAQKGYGSLTVRKIAKEIGISTGTLYHYFSSKEDLFIQLVEEITEQDILNANDEIANQNLVTIEAKILALGQFVIKHEQYFHQQTSLYMNFWQQPLEQKELIEAVKNSYKRYQEEIIKFLDIDNIAIAKHLAALVDGLLLQRFFAPELTDLEEQMQLLAQMLGAYLDK